jgi:hypothetical protein
MKHDFSGSDVTRGRGRHGIVRGGRGRGTGRGRGVVRGRGRGGVATNRRRPRESTQEPGSADNASPTPRRRRAPVLPHD